MWERLKQIRPFWWFVAFFVLVNVLWLGPSLFGGRTLKKGVQAPSFHLPRLGQAGESLSLGDVAGHVTVLAFWATWCDACMAEIPVLVELARQQGASGVKVVGMNLEPENRPAVERFLASRPLPYPNVVVDQATAEAYRVKILPTIYVLDGQGRVCRGYTGRVGAMRLGRAVQRCGR